MGDFAGRGIKCHAAKQLMVIDTVCRLIRMQALYWYLQAAELTTPHPTGRTNLPVCSAGLLGPVSQADGTVGGYVLGDFAGSVASCQSVHEHKRHQKSRRMPVSSDAIRRFFCCCGVDFSGMGRGAEGCIRRFWTTAALIPGSLPADIGDAPKGSCQQRISPLRKGCACAAFSGIVGIIVK